MSEIFLNLDAEDKEVAQLALSLIMVDSHHCTKCKTEFMQGVCCSDTDMVPIFLSSVYAPTTSTLVVAQLTHEEYLHGWQERLPKRISPVFDNQAFYYISFKQTCPICGGLLTCKTNRSLSDYIKTNQNTFVVYQNNCLEQKIIKF